MGKIYVGQTALKFRDTVGIDLTGATAQIKYRKPDGTEGAWDADIYGDAADGVIEYAVEDGDILDQSGKWVRWAYVTFGDGTIAPGEPIEFIVYQEGK